MKSKRDAQKWQKSAGTGTKGTGRNKVRSKQREYQSHCRDSRVAGMVNRADGGWMDNSAAVALLGDKRVRAITGR